MISVMKSVAQDQTDASQLTHHHLRHCLSLSTFDDFSLAEIPRFWNGNRALSC